MLNTPRPNDSPGQTIGPSQACPQLGGIEGLYYDLMNGIPRTDIPGGIPTVKQIGGSYTHPTVPLLSFIYPAGYAPQTDNTQGAVGVNLVRSDNRSVWRYTVITVFSNPTPIDVLNFEVAQMRNFLQATGAIQTVCSQQASLPRAPGIVTNAASVLITFDGFTSVITAAITSQEGLGAVQVAITMSVAPTAEFGTEVLNTWLPIGFQLLYKDNGEPDSDGDGFNDTVDNAPFDPARH